jgi:hypothetical protein
MIEAKADLDSLGLSGGSEFECMETLVSVIFIPPFGI